MLKTYYCETSKANKWWKREEKKCGEQKVERRAHLWRSRESCCCFRAVIVRVLSSMSEPCEVLMDLLVSILRGSCVRLELKHSTTTRRPPDNSEWSASHNQPTHRFRTFTKERPLNQGRMTKLPTTASRGSISEADEGRVLMVIGRWGWMEVENLGGGVRDVINIFKWGCIGFLHCLNNRHSGSQVFNLGIGKTYLPLSTV